MTDPPVVLSLDVFICLGRSRRRSSRASIDDRVNLATGEEKEFGTLTWSIDGRCSALSR